MVFEDDATFYKNPNCYKHFQNAWKEKNTIRDWEALFLGGFNIGLNYQVTPTLSRGLRTFGAHGYILNRGSMKKVMSHDFTGITRNRFFEVSLNQFDISVLSALRGYQLSPFIIYQYKIPRLIKTMEYIYDFSGGKFEQFLFRWNNTMWLIVIFVSVFAGHYFFQFIKK